MDLVVLRVEKNQKYERIKSYFTKIGSEIGIEEMKTAMRRYLKEK